jgi:cysteine desulfuration protein SufE
MTTEETIDQIAAELAQFDDWEDRYAHIIAMSKTLNPMPPDHQTETFLVQGCQSKVWLYPSFDGEKVHFEADSDAVIVKGLVAMLMRIYNHRTPKEILSVSGNFVERLGLTTHLSQNRANGLASMVKQISMYALALSVAHGK